MEEEVKQAQATETAAENTKETVEEKVAETGEAQAGQKEAENAKEAEPVDPKDEQLKELNNRLLRLQADFDNYRRRTNAEKDALSGFVTANVVGKFLKILDNFERAEASAAKNVDADAVMKGLAQIRKQFDETLKALKVEEIPTLNQKFDANFHEAIMRGHNPEFEDEIIDMVLEKGYKLGERVIRPSKVRVNSNED